MAGETEETYTVTWGLKHHKSWNRPSPGDFNDTQAVVHTLCLCREAPGAEGLGTQIRNSHRHLFGLHSRSTLIDRFCTRIFLGTVLILECLSYSGIAKVC